MIGSHDRPAPQRFVGALVGAALGDALGWPHEQRASSVGRAVRGLHLEDWQKKSGGRFQPHVETIGAGSYSDDTQLMLAVARSRLSHARWWEHLAFVELPFWTLYERGGGGATLRSARSLLRGHLPWETKPDDVAKYFQAGGNGVAMRISPHALLGAQDETYLEVACAIMGDGVVTHGHPRALVGALAYGFALWTAIRTRGTLKYGALIRALDERVADWASPPDIRNIWPTWAEAADRMPQFHAQWDEAVHEIMVGLHIASSGLSAGDLANDEEIMGSLGCFRRDINGAGTVAASAAVYLASKHAAAPLEGLARAALAKGADTDTIGSMVGGLAGAVSGLDWMGHHPARLQDLDYIGRIGARLGHPEQQAFQLGHRSRFSAKDAETFYTALSRGARHVVIPFGDDADVATTDLVEPLAANLSAHVWRLTERSGQTLFVKKLSRARSNTTGTKSKVAKPGLVGSLAAIRLYVNDLSKARRIYEDCLGLKASSQSPTHVQFGDMFALRQGETRTNAGSDVVLFFGVSNVVDAREKLLLTNIGQVGAITQKSGRAAFACLDGDGHRFEVFQE